MSNKPTHVEDIHTQHKRQETVQVGKELGAMIQKARLAAKKSLGDVSNELKIQIKYLQAIEDGDASKVPSIFYYLSFIKSYVNYLDLDPKARELHEKLKSHHQNIGVYTGNSLNILMQSRYNRSSFSFLLSFIVLSVIVITFALVYFFSQNNVDTSVKRVAIESANDHIGNQVTIVASEKTFIKLLNNFNEVIFEGHLNKNETKVFYPNSGMILKTDNIQNLTIFLNGAPLSDLDTNQDNQINILRGPSLIKSD